MKQFVYLVTFSSITAPEELYVCHERIFFEISDRTTEPIPYLVHLTSKIFFSKLPQRNQVTARHTTKIFLPSAHGRASPATPKRLG